MASLTLAACTQGSATASDEEAGHALGLYTSLPITWGESDDIGDLLSPDRPGHWALPVLKSAGDFVPLDSLADADGAMPLPQDAILVLAQPRPLSPQENVALDKWVAGGGHVLLLADPMLTSHSRFALGDPRRPQDIALLSPILARWGLELEFDDAQAPGEYAVSLSEGALPVNLPGRFRLLGKSGEAGARGKTGDIVGDCRLEAEGVLADCRSGKGHIVAVADAALLENPPDSAAVARRTVILEKLLQRTRSGT
ncbi:DUF4350 domain-containing protein [Novosphingobium malaysiense]|uniref:DUF4350 domain-containing protein n=1 Tax=Novosphingobium malaysiense TaxID=1348853 RepID=UPI000A749A1B|nr:DUF4350 domain-containing protein [Novosphingobium malaysiense]